MTDSEMIDAWLGRHAPTLCPTVFVVPSQQLAKDKFVVEPLVKAGEKIEDTIVRLYRDHNYACHFLATMSGLGQVRVSQILGKAGVLPKGGNQANAWKRNAARNEEAIRLYNDGISAKEIAKRVGLHVKHVRGLLQGSDEK
jgi:hypothetical protein